MSLAAGKEWNVAAAHGDPFRLDQDPVGASYFQVWFDRFDLSESSRVDNL
jgi:hypothetical protein